MSSAAQIVLAAGVLIGALAAATQTPPITGPVDLVKAKLRGVNREVSPLTERPDAVHVSEKEGNGVVWVEGTDLADGTIELEVRGRDVLQRSFLGVAFHRTDDGTYEAVYLRPFNFRAADPARHQHAVQYIAVPEYDWPRLRQEFAEEFENPVDASISPTGWVRLRVVIKAQAVQIYVGSGSTPALDVRKLGRQSRGMVGLWVGNTSDGDFANLRVTPAR